MYFTVILYSPRFDDAEVQKDMKMVSYKIVKENKPSQDFYLRINQQNQNQKPDFDSRRKIRLKKNECSIITNI